MRCPNINSPEWKALVDKIGENNAWREFLANGYIPSADNYDVIESISKETTQQIKPGVQELFESNPELANIGTPEQYSQYLDQIFPDSKVKDIVYHGTNAEFDKFDKSKLKENTETALSKIGFNFVNSRRIASKYGKLKSVILNIINLKEINIRDIEVPLEVRSHYESYYASKLKNISEDGVILEFPEGQEEYVVFEPEQIHILSSKKDLEMFKNFINFTKSEYAKYGDVQQFRDYIMSKNFAAVEEFLVVNNKIDRKC